MPPFACSNVWSIPFHLEGFHHAPPVLYHFMMHGIAITLWLGPRAYWKHQFHLHTTLTMLTYFVKCKGSADNATATASFWTSEPQGERLSRGMWRDSKQLLHFWFARVIPCFHGSMQHVNTWMSAMLKHSHSAFELWVSAHTSTKCHYVILALLEDNTWALCWGVAHIPLLNFHQTTAPFSWWGWIISLIDWPLLVWEDDVVESCFRLVLKVQPKWNFSDVPHEDFQHWDCQLPTRTAQGGGGSFKDTKPVGEVGCCYAWMAEQIHCRSKSGWSVGLSICLSICLCN